MLFFSRLQTMTFSTLANVINPYVKTPSLTFGFASKIYVLSLPARTDRRRDMEHLRKTLGLDWTYIEAIDAENPIVNRILNSVRLIRSTRSFDSAFTWPSVEAGIDEPIDAWDSDFLAPMSTHEQKPSYYRPLVCATDNDTITPYDPSLPEHRLLTAARIACWYSHLSVIHNIANDLSLRLNEPRLDTDFLQPISYLLEYQSKLLQSTPFDHENWAELTELSQSARQKLFAGTQDLQGQIGITDLEFSVGRLGPGDLKRVNGELRSIAFRASALRSFQQFVHRIYTSHTAETEVESVDEDKSGYWDRYTILQKEIWQHEVKHGHDLDSLIPIIAESSADLRDACGGVINALTEWFHGCNSGRWTGLFTKYDKVKGDQRHATLVEQRAALQTALEQYREIQRVKIIQPYERFFDPVTGQRLKSNDASNSDEMFAARSLYICFVFSFGLDAFADSLTKFMSIVIDIDGKRPKPRVWAPSGFGKLGRKIMSKQDVSPQVAPLAVGTSQDPISFDEDHEDAADDDEEPEAVPQDKGTKRKNPDALPPTTAFGRFFLCLGKILRFFKSPEGIFGLRHAVVSLALWIPSVCPSTAWFYYGNRGLWALIMAQTGLAVYAGDQIAGFVVRIVGTVAGLLVGMAVWYIGAGNGPGNPYGVVIATNLSSDCLHCAFPTWTACRTPSTNGLVDAFWCYNCIWLVVKVLSNLFLHPIVVSAVVGFSWVDKHLAVLNNSGVGVEIGWKRAYFIVMLFPRPTSSRTLVRRTLAATAGELGVVLAVEVEALLAEEARAREGHHEKVVFVGEHSNQKASPKELRVRRIGQKALAVASRLQGLIPSLQTGKFEPQLSGLWPYKKYAAIHEMQTSILSALMLFIGAFMHLDTEWCSTLVHKTPFLNPNLLSDIFSNLSIVSYALNGGHPLPPGLPRLRDRIVYHERMNPVSRSRRTSDASILQPDLSSVADKIDGSNIGFSQISLDILKDKELPAHATALVALSSIITLVDELTVVVRELCGEMTFQGFAEFQRDFLGREEKAIGGGYRKMGLS
ncbi:hypothetical protein H0H93_005443 [Arthromyces matolae]|nr:hypothetical protein H0H93_005443 [Arthromyces matolae]